MGYDFGVGREAPTFTLSSVDGDEIRLSQYRGDWFPVLVFMSAGAPDAARQLEQLSAVADTLWGLRGQIVVICDAGRAACAELTDRGPAPAFPVLHDGGAVAHRYGVRRHDGTARTMAFIVDRSGKIVWTGEGGEALEAAALVAAFRDVVR